MFVWSVEFVPLFWYWRHQTQEMHRMRHMNYNFEMYFLFFFFIDTVKLLRDRNRSGASKHFHTGWHLLRQQKAKILKYGSITTWGGRLFPSMIVRGKTKNLNATFVYLYGFIVLRCVHLVDLGQKKSHICIFFYSKLVIGDEVNQFKMVYSPSFP